MYVEEDINSRSQTKDRATLAYFVFECADEQDAITAALNFVPGTYADMYYEDHQYDPVNDDTHRVEIQYSVNGSASETRSTWRYATNGGTTRVKPAGSSDSFLILQDGLPEQNMATRAVSDGITPAWITFTESDTTAETAGPTADSFDLKPGGTGAEILWKPDGTGSLLCVIRIHRGGGDSGCCYNFVGVLLEDLEAGESAECMLFTAESVQLKSVEVKDSIMPGGSKISEGTTVYVAKFHGCEYRVTGVACDSLDLDACGLYLEDE